MRGSAPRKPTVLQTVTAAAPAAPRDLATTLLASRPTAPHPTYVPRLRQRRAAASTGDYFRRTAPWPAASSSPSSS